MPNHVGENLDHIPSRKVSFLPFILVALLGIQRDVHHAYAETLSGPSMVSENKRDALRRAFLSLGEQVVKDLETYVRDPQMRNKIRKIFDEFRINPRICSDSEEGEVPLGTQKGFCLRFAPQFHPASFNGKRRTMSLTKDFDPADILSLATLAHETSHVLQDDELRARVPWDRYRAYWSVPNIDGTTVTVVPHNEAESIATSLEILNVASHGALRKDATSGRPLAIRTRDPYLKAFFQQCAQHYYTSPSTFVSFVEEIYRGAPGAVFFSEDLVPIK